MNTFQIHYDLTLVSHSESEVRTFCNLFEAQKWDRDSGFLCFGLESPLAKSQPPMPQPLGAQDV